MTRVTATLVQVHGHGVLLRGPAGSGKSDTALALVHAGYTLVSDDGVDLHPGPQSLMGAAPAAGYGLLYLRGIGLIDVAKQFGAQAVQRRCAIRLVIDLIEERQSDTPEGQWSITHLAGVAIPRLALAPERPLSALIPTAVRHRPVTEQAFACG